MKKLIVIPLLLIFCMFSDSRGSTDTLTDISNWIIFYTNIHRVVNGKQPLWYNETLTKPAKWQADYCMDNNTLTHTSSVSGMHDVRDRILHFDGSGNYCGENVLMITATDSEMSSETFSREMAYKMVGLWMKSPGHKKNILTGSFRNIGVGTSSKKSQYGNTLYSCQVFDNIWYTGGFTSSASKEPSDFSDISVSYKKVNGQKTYTVTYSGSLDLKIIDVKRDEPLSSYDTDQEGNTYTFTKDKAQQGYLFVALLDSKTKMLYPVKLITQ